MTQRRGARRLLRPALPPSRRLPRRGANARNRSPRWRSAGGRYPTEKPVRRLEASAAGDIELEAKLGAADAQLVEILELRLAFETRPVQERPVGGVHVLNVVAGPAGIDAGVNAGRVSVLDADIRLCRAAY